MSSATSSASIAAPPAAPAANSTASDASTKPKPCCVCKPEKAARDDCMLFSKSDNPTELECRSLVDQYKSCMAGYGFKI